MTTAQLVWILAPRLPEPDGGAESDDNLGMRESGTDDTSMIEMRR